jgi:hypothetical protein
MHADGIEMSMLGAALVSWLGHARRNVEFLMILDLYKSML